MDGIAIAGAGSSTSLAQSIAGNRQLGQQEFLKLLVTELTNQDPMSPQDDKAFLAQMAQFATVEGVNRMGSGVAQFQAAALIGKTVDAVVTANGAQQLVSGVVKAVKLTPDGAKLTVGAQEVDLSQVQTIRGS